LRNFAKYYLLIITLFLGCRPMQKSEEDSAVKQLVPSYLTCDSDPTRTARVKQKYGSFFSGSGKEQAFAATANIPEEILSFIFEQRSTRVSLRGLGRGGSTSSGGSSISVSSGVGSLAHELGHAAHYSYMRKRYNNFESALNSAYNSARRNESRSMRSYSTTQAQEYFADTFDSYYCSRASRANMKVKFPRTYQFAAKYLVVPLSEAGPNGDNDHDGVINSDDLCSHTAEQAEINSSVGLGCGANQLTDDEDTDRDGVSNESDKCPATLLYVPVAKEGEKIGCRLAPAPTNNNSNSNNNGRRRGRRRGR